MVNIADVARHAGVSRSTVSYVLSGKRQISAGTRQRVQDSIEALGFQRDPAALALTTRQTCTIGLAATIRLDAPDIDVVALRDFAMEIAFRLRRQGYDMLLLAQPAHEQMERLKRGLLTDGLIVMDVLWHDERVPALRQAPFPVLLMGAPEDDQGLSVADLDYRAAGKLAIEHLAALGHRRIALVSGPIGLNSVTRVESGAMSAVAGTPDAHLTVISGTAAASESVAAELDTISDCTAVIIHDQHQLPVFLNTMAAAGIRTPEDLSVLAIATGSTLERSLPVTSIEVPVGTIVQQAVDAIMAAVRTGTHTKTLIPPQLTDRGTTSRRPGNGGQDAAPPPPG